METKKRKNREKRSVFLNPPLHLVAAPHLLFPSPPELPHLPSPPTRLGSRAAVGRWDRLRALVASLPNMSLIHPRCFHLPPTPPPSKWPPTEITLGCESRSWLDHGPGYNPRHDPQGAALYSFGLENSRFPSASTNLGTL